MIAREHNSLTEQFIVIQTKYTSMKHFTNIWLSLRKMQKKNAIRLGRRFVFVCVIIQTQVQTLALSKL